MSDATDDFSVKVTGTSQLLLQRAIACVECHHGGAGWEGWAEAYRDNDPALMIFWHVPKDFDPAPEAFKVQRFESPMSRDEIVQFISAWAKKNKPYGGDRPRREYSEGFEFTSHGRDAYIGFEVYMIWVEYSQ